MTDSSYASLWILGEGYRRAIGAIIEHGDQDLQVGRETIVEKKLEWNNLQAFGCFVRVLLGRKSVLLI